MFKGPAPWHHPVREEIIMRHMPISALAALSCTARTGGAFAADVPYERLLQPEPHNWLMNHHDYAAQRHSALTMINKQNVKGLHLAFAVPLGGTSGNEYVEA